ncbi:MAG: type II toxin-antitoxin system PemK/MazF family toxin [Candidatus Nanopelagicales bacterium]|nr:type II toxin-antitoxin system PemK/MazF family toxin [Candidatus Nanopelagicales bacterium]
MRPIHLAALDKTRPVVVLTREQVIPFLNSVTVTPITTTIRGLSTEVRVGSQNGLDAESVISCDNVTTVPRDSIGKHIGFLFPFQEKELSRAIRAAARLD